MANSKADLVVDRAGLTGPLTPNSKRRMVAISLTLLAMLLLAAVDGTSKYLSATYSPVQIMWTRLICFTVFVLAKHRTDWRTVVKSHRPGLQIVRSVVLTVEVGLFILAFKYLPLADVHAIGAFCPLLTVLLACLFLGERASSTIFLALILGLIGVMLVLRPHLDVLRWEVAYPIGGAVLWSVYQVLTRQVSKFDPAATTAFFTPVVGLLLTTILLPWFWVAPSVSDAALLIVSGLVGAAAHYFVIQALMMSEASRLQPFNFTIFVWAIVFGYLFFGDTPTTMMLVGAAMVIASSLYAARSHKGAW